MPRGSFDAILDYVRRVTRPLAGEAGEGDALLLHRFTEAGDEEAFATLVRRHGPMVWGVCTRTLSTPQDAEDAFQATFLVLVRKARSLDRPEQVSPWLYGVALRTALKARAEAARRRVREKVVMAPPAPESSDVLQRDLRRVLDEEVGRLPARYRVPFLLCHVEGLTNEEAARRLGCPRGTVLSRLSRAREMLRRRLARRGLGLSGAALAAALSDNFGAAAVPPALLESTIRLSLSVAAGSAASALSAQAAFLAEGVLNAMFLSKLKVAAILLLSLGIVGSGVGLLNSANGPGPTAAVAQEPPAPDKVGKKEASGGPEKKVEVPADVLPLPIPDGGEKKAEAPAVPVEEQARAFRDKLAQPVSNHGYDDPKVTLTELLDQLTKIYDLQFEVNDQAFEDQGLSKVLAYEVAARRPLPPVKNVTLATLLRLVLERLPVPATYVIRKDTIEITTVAAVRAELGIAPDRPLLPLVWEDFENVPLPDALQRLAKASGMSVVLDPRALPAEQAKMTVSGQFASVPVDTAVRVLANMADLQAVRLDNVLYVTTPKRAAQLQAETKPAEEAPRPEPSPRQFGRPAGGSASFG